MASIPLLPNRKTMKIHYRKSINLGNTRINIADGGVGFSHGINGLRAGVDAKGKKYISGGIPGTGFYFREYFRKSPSQLQLRVSSKADRRKANVIVLGIGLSIVVLTVWGVICANF